MGTQDSGPVAEVEASARRFVITMKTEDNLAEPRVRSCEIVTSKIRNRTSFSTLNTRLHDVFIKEIADAISDCIAKLSGETEVLSLPTFYLELPGLILAGAQLLSSQSKDGRMHIIVRFQMVVGGVNLAFKEDIGFGHDIQNQNAYLSAAVLSDIALPLLNICAVADSDLHIPDHDFREFSAYLNHRSQEIKFQIEIVKRFVEQNERGVGLPLTAANINTKRPLIN